MGLEFGVDTMQVLEIQEKEAITKENELTQKSYSIHCPVLSSEAKPRKLYSRSQKLGTSLASCPYSTL